MKPANTSPRKTPSRVPCRGAGTQERCSEHFLPAHGMPFCF
jgi:hypothetical protein